MAEKSRAREAAAEAKRSRMLESAERARIAREQSGPEKEKEVERQAEVRRARQQEVERCGGCYVCDFVTLGDRGYTSQCARFARQKPSGK